MVIRTRDWRQLWLPLPHNTANMQEALMKKGDAYPPRYFSAATFGDKPRVFTIECVRKEKFENDGKTTEKPVMYFKGERSGFVLGPTKWDQAADFLCDESDRWPNNQAELFPDTTFFAGRKVPTISIRKPGMPPPKGKAKKPKPDSKPDFDDSIDM
jgi:hypothetical protein